MVGYVISLSTMVVAGRYVSMFLMATGYAGACGVVNECDMVLIEL